MISTRKGTQEDFPQLLALQQQYLVTNLSEEEKKDGFVTTLFTEIQLKQILDENGMFVALDQDKIVGYVFAASWSFFSQWPIFPFMSARFPQLSYNGKTITTENSFQYGPVCIDKDYRGKNILQLLFEQVQVNLQSRYPFGATFINKKNPRSFHAHTTKLPLTVIDEFEFNNNQYWTLAFYTDKNKK